MAGTVLQQLIDELLQPRDVAQLVARIAHLEAQVATLMTLDQRVRNIEVDIRGLRAGWIGCTAVAHADAICTGRADHAQLSKFTQQREHTESPDDPPTT